MAGPLSQVLTTNHHRKAELERSLVLPSDYVLNHRTDRKKDLMPTLEYLFVTTPIVIVTLWVLWPRKLRIAIAINIGRK